jgi:hypothetical protein
MRVPLGDSIHVIRRTHAEARRYETAASES